MRLLGVIIAALALAGAARAYNPADLAPTTVCHVGGKTQMLCLHNWTRKQHGLAPLVAAPALYTSAGQKADLIDQCREFSHTPCGHDAFEFLLPTGLCAACAENIVYGFPNVRSTYAAWLDSPPPYADIVNPNVRLYGSAFRAAWVPGLWVVNFGAA